MRFLFNLNSFFCLSDSKQEGLDVSAVISFQALRSHILSHLSSPSRHTSCERLSFDNTVGWYLCLNEAAQLLDHKDLAPAGPRCLICVFLRPELIQHFFLIHNPLYPKQEDRGGLGCLISPILPFPSVFRSELMSQHPLVCLFRKFEWFWLAHWLRTTIAGKVLDWMILRVRLTCKIPWCGAPKRLANLILHYYYYGMLIGHPHRAQWRLNIQPHSVFRR